MNKLFRNFRSIINFKTIIGLIISIVGIYLAFYDFDISTFLYTVGSIKYEYVLLACMLLIFSVWLRALRWKLLFKMKDGVNTYSLFQYELIGYFGNNILPLRLGELLRTYMLGKQYSLPKPYVFGTIVLERILDTFSLVFLSLLLLIIYPLNDFIRNYIYLGILISLVILFLLLALNKMNLVKINKGFLSFIARFVDGFKNIKYKKIPNLSILSILIWCVYWLDVHLIQAAFGFSMTISHSLLLLVVTTLFMSIPSAPGMIGTFHLGVKYVMVILFVDSYIFTTSQVASFAIVLHAYGYISYTVIGAIYFVRSQFNINAINEVLIKSE